MRTPPYEIAGHGEPLLLLSGYAMPASCLDTVKAPLIERFSVITFDYPGSGAARPAVVPTSIPGLAALAVQLLDHLGVRSAHVFGLSMGGLVAQELAIRFPGRVRRLVLGATTPGGVRAVLPDVWTFMSAVSTMTNHPHVHGRPRPSGLLMQGVAASVHDTSLRLGRIQAETLVLHGQLDRLVPPSNALLLHRGIPRSRLAIIRNAGHFTAFEDPELTAGVILEWFGTTSAIPGRLTGMAGRLEPLSRAFALPVGMGRAPLTHCVRAVAGAESLRSRCGVE
jgi:3-oxoadipate enol-lactonase